MKILITHIQCIGETGKKPDQDNMSFIRRQLNDVRLSLGLQLGGTNAARTPHPTILSSV